MCKTEVIKFPQTEMISLCFLFWKHLILTLAPRLQPSPCWTCLRLPSPWHQAWVSSFTQTLPGSPSERLFSLPHLNHLLTACLWKSGSVSCGSVLTYSCDPMDSSPPGSSVHGILQARILEWVAISFSKDLPDPGTEPGSPALQVDSLPSESPGNLLPA